MGSAFSTPVAQSAPEPDSKARQEARRHGIYHPSDLKLKAQWDEADSWQRMLDLNREYLIGNIDFTPYYSAPIHEETRPMVPGLLALHDFGMLTYSSQPASNTGPTKIECACCPGEYEVAKQRAFLSFLIPGDESLISKAKLEEFINALLDGESFYTSIQSNGGICQYSGCVMAPRVVSSFPDFKDWETHFVKRAASVEELDGGESKPKRFFQQHCSCILRSFQNENEVAQMSDLIIVHVLAKSYEEVDLAVEVERVAEEVGLERSFTESG